MGTGTSDSDIVTTDSGLGASFDLNPGGDWSWNMTRQKYLNALTSGSKSIRDTNFANTFQGLGQLMHLIQDISVPEHTRNDFHAFGGYEGWVANPNNVTISAVTPTFFSGTINSISSFFDTDQYTEINPSPDVTKSNTIGLAEYTNANFLSPGTMFTDYLPTTDKHYFPYPKRTSAVLWTDMTTTTIRNYFKKTGDGEPIDHLAAVSLLYIYRLTYFPQNNSYLPVGLDPKCKGEYASKLLPRAIGYSAGLLNYFFRGNIKYIPDPNNPGQNIIVNGSNENLSGTFSLYYDDTSDNRISVPNAVWPLTINANGQSGPLSFTAPIASAQKNPGTFLLVFTGQMGQELNAVIGQKGSYCRSSSASGSHAYFTFGGGAYLTGLPMIMAYGGKLSAGVMEIMRCLLMRGRL